MWYYKTERSLLNDLFNENSFNYESSLLSNNKDGTYSIKVNLAGYDKSEVDLSVENGKYIYITANNKELGNTEKKYKLIGLESITSDDVKAKLKNGLLYITIQDGTRKNKKSSSVKIE